MEEKIKMDAEWFMQDGNAYALLGKCRKQMLRAGKLALWDEFYKEATSGNYDHLLATIMEYFELVDESELDEEKEDE